MRFFGTWAGFFIKRLRQDVGRKTKLEKGAVVLGRYGFLIEHTGDACTGKAQYLRKGAVSDVMFRHPAPQSLRPGNFRCCHEWSLLLGFRLLN